ncbi:hypothetical protein DL89DRAFT_267779 [Linderina pennispora]|uniref:RNA-binding domain-containing protein n=1 Tax=Linderina pennispora TaxID=61395 RepID=A0A1Y1W7T7_9FUNG|nr:uncharacterized protein DL89DRAFT_267779 [Linderina pennispora]ORX69593.1 hypothetical protein DL89DRAFT_267779 [Linderina pennispora]
MTLFVAHVNEQATEDDLRKLFEPFGTITDIDKKRTYAFIDYADIESTDSAIKALHNMEFMGSKLRVEVSNKTRGDDGPSLGDLQEQCYHCKEIGHIAKNCP